MKQYFSILCLFLSITVPSFAQLKLGHNFELGGTYNYVSARYSDGTKLKINGPGAFFEYRYTVENNFDIGGKISYGCAEGNNYKIVAQENPSLMKYHQGWIKLLGDYNICPTHIIYPYVGLETGIGVTFMRSKNITNENYFSYVFTPRIGFQVWHFRFGCEFDFLCDRIRHYSASRGSSHSYSAYSSVIALNLGITF